jgi:hypothetical protein
VTPRVALVSRRAAIGLLGLALAWPAPIFAQQERPTFSGRASGVRATIGTLPPIVLSDTGPLPESGGAQEASLLAASIPGELTGGVLVLSAEALHATTIGQGDRSRSEASLANLDMTVAGNSIAADFLTAQAEAACTGAGPQVGGRSDLAQLVINGQPVAVSGAPNQRIDLVTGGYVVVNEQSSSVEGNYGEITVNALHVVIPGVADVVVASAHADIQCQGQPDCAAAKDFVTGGGWIVAPSGGKGTFGVAGGIKDGLWGHLTYTDHGARLKVKGTAVTDYEVLDPQTRRVAGTAEINGTPETYEVIVSDRGEPGRDDTFWIELSNGYAASGTLEGGNIQLHTPCP